MKLFFNRKFDLQTKLALILASVIIPIFILVTLAEYQLTRPLLEQEFQHIGITAAQTLASQIESQKLLTRKNRVLFLENRIQELIYVQPDLIRVDVLVHDAELAQSVIIASNVEEDPVTGGKEFEWVEKVKTEIVDDELTSMYWDVLAPVKAQGKVIANVHVSVSMKLVENVLETFWKITVPAAILSVVILIGILFFLLRRTIENDRKLSLAQSQNLILSRELSDAGRTIMNMEKLAVMGQLTASFAHEIGTPLNAIGGHLQLLEDELSRIQDAKGELTTKMLERVEVITGQLFRIETIVKSFLQSTAKPVSQSQLVDLNQVVDKSVQFLRPRLSSLHIKLELELNRSLGPIRAAPMEVEQLILNLLNNSVDSLNAKGLTHASAKKNLWITTKEKQSDGLTGFLIEIEDSGAGISKEDMERVFQPFFTTKAPGEGTGLGLTICKEIAGRYGGVIEIDSKEGAWTKVSVFFPFQR